MSYLVHTVPGGIDEAVRTIERACKGHLHEFQSVLCTGLSGIIPAAIFCARHKKNLTVLRKQDESRHSCAEVEGPAGWDCTKRGHIIIDDFVADGYTLERLRNATKRPAKFIVLYKGYGLALRSHRINRHPGYYRFHTGLTLKRDRKLRFHFANLPEVQCESSSLEDRSEIPF